MARRRGEKDSKPKGSCVPAPAAHPDEGGLPHALTFFLTRDQRRAVLRALRRVDEDRARALLRVLGVG